MSTVPCELAEPQAPRDVSPSAVGTVVPKVPALTVEEVAKLVHTNTHWHEGTEHYSAGHYDIPEPRVRPANHTPGYSCSPSTLTAAQLSPYAFRSCKDVAVGKTYEVHWVYGSGGTRMSDGLGGAFARTSNAAVAVQAQVYVVVNDERYESHLLERAWNASLATNAVRYVGSTTGTPYDNVACSPISVTWHVDRECQLLSAASFDAMCEAMHRLYGMDVDLTTHGSRALVWPAFASTLIEPLHPSTSVAVAHSPPRQTTLDAEALLAAVFAALFVVTLVALTWLACASGFLSCRMRGIGGPKRAQTIIPTAGRAFTNLSRSHPEEMCVRTLLQDESSSESSVTAASSQPMPVL